MSQRPTQDEYAPYYERYVQLVPEGSIQEIMAKQLEETIGLLHGMTETSANYRYAADKWSIKEVVGHITDNERIMAYRLLWVARGLQTPLAGYDQDSLMKGACFHQWSVKEIIEDYAAVRRSTLTLLHGLSEEAWTRQGTVNNGAASARAIAYILAGHERHHVNVLHDKYSV